MGREQGHAERIEALADTPEVHLARLTQMVEHPRCAGRGCGARRALAVEDAQGVDLDAVAVLVTELIAVARAR